MIEWIEAEFENLKGSLVGDSFRRRFPVYLPPNYDPKRAEPYPVAYLLSGWGARSAKYLADDSAFRPPLDLQFDEAIRSSQVPPLLVVFVDAVSKFGHSQYVNSPVLGNYSDYLSLELPKLVDSKFHTHSSGDFRIIAGHSSGGYGALLNSALHPESFKWVIASASDANFEQVYFPAIHTAIEEIEKAGSVERFIEDFLGSPNPSGLGHKKFETMNLLSMAPCYLPNPSKPPLFGDLFFDLHTGQIDWKLWERFKAWDPVQFLPKHLANLKKLSFIQLEAGSNDQYGLQLGHRWIKGLLETHKIPHELREYPGGHGGHSWRFLDRFQRILKQMRLEN